MSKIFTIGQPQTLDQVKTTLIELERDLNREFGKLVPSPRTITPAEYARHNAVVNLLDYDISGRQINTGAVNCQDDLTRAINEADGKPIWAPAGTYLCDFIKNKTGKPLCIIGDGDYTQGTIFQTTATPAEAFQFAVDAPSQFLVLKDFILAGTPQNTGAFGLGKVESGGWTPSAPGVGTAWNTAAFVYLENVRIIYFSNLSAYAVSMNAVQEFQGNNVFMDQNYYNVYRPAKGFVTSSEFYGMNSYVGNSTKAGVQIEGPIYDLRFRSVPFESCLGSAIKVASKAVKILVDGCYVENCCINSGDAFEIDGALGNPASIIIQHTRFISRGRPASKYLNFDKVRNSRVSGNFDLFASGAVGVEAITTANSQVHFEDNADGVDVIPIYQALPGKITWAETDLQGVRMVGSTSGGLRISGRTPANSGAPGLPGTVAWDANYIYTCIAPNTWKRAPVATW